MKHVFSWSKCDTLTLFSMARSKYCFSYWRMAKSPMWLWCCGSLFKNMSPDWPSPYQKLSIGKTSQVWTPRLEVKVVKYTVHVFRVSYENQVGKNRLGPSLLVPQAQARTHHLCTIYACEWLGSFGEVEVGEKLHGPCIWIIRDSVVSVPLAAPSFPDKRTSIKALTMKDYENVSACWRSHHWSLVQFTLYVIYIIYPVIVLCRISYCISWYPLPLKAYACVCPTIQRCMAWVAINWPCKSIILPLHAVETVLNGTQPAIS